MRILLLGLGLLVLTGCEPKSSLPPVTSMPSRLQPYVAGLLDKNQDMRWQAARELALCGSDAAPAVPFLTAALNDPHNRVQLFAVLALGEIGPSAKNALPCLQEIADHDTNDELATAAKRSVAKIMGTN